MNLIYNSPHFCVIEFADPLTLDASVPADSATPASRGGFEIMDKAQRREIYLHGALADAFRADVARLSAEQPSPEDIDAFLMNFQGLMQQPLIQH